MPERGLNILFLQDATDKSFDSVKLINRLFLGAISGEKFTHILPQNNLSEDEWNMLLRQHDVILGFNKEALQVRAKQKISIPMLFPGYGLGVRGLLPLFEFKNLFAQGDGVVSPSSKDFESIDMHLKDNQLHRFMVPFCLPIDYFSLDTKEMNKQQIAESLNLNYSQENRYLLCAGRINRQKNVHKLFPVIQSLNEAGLKVHLLIAGTEDSSDFLEMGIKTAGYEQELRQKVKEDANLKDCVHFLGLIPPEKMPRLYYLADLNTTASTYRSEDFGFIPVEAMALGVPTLGTNWGGLRDTIREGVTGFRMAVTLNSDGLDIDIASGIIFAKEVLTNPILRKQMEVGAKNAVSDYHPAKFAEGLIKCLKELVEHKKGRFTSLNLPQLVSSPVLEFFNEIEGEIARGKNIFEARNNKFKENDLKYFKAFLGTYYN